MRLLVSVRSADEVGAALAGGADIIDVKEPSRGTLGAADPHIIAAVAAQVPPAVPLSIALGDPDGSHVRSVVDQLAIHRKTGDLILKLGFAGSTDEADVAARLSAAIAGLRGASLVAVAYADWERAGAPSPTAILGAASRAGISGLLMDTFSKESGNLFSWISPQELTQWAEAARSRRLVIALAGSVDSESMPRMQSARPDVIGVRGAACDGGRLGRVSAARVRALRVALNGFQAQARHQPPAIHQDIASRPVG
jgi:(5-formylfuran-3-yl)methyl phosphate synthase